MFRDSACLGFVSPEMLVVYFRSFPSFLIPIKIESIMAESLVSCAVRNEESNNEVAVLFKK